MAKSKSPSETTAEFLSSIKYYEGEDNSIIVILPEGLSVSKKEIKDGKLNLKLDIEGVETFKLIGSLKATDDIEKVQILSVEDAKAFVG